MSERPTLSTTCGRARYSAGDVARERRGRQARLQFAQDAAEAMRAGQSLEEEAFTAIFDPEFVLVEIADFPDADSYRRFDGLKRWLAGFLDIYDDVEAVPQDFVVVGEDTVMVSVHQRFPSKTGVVLEQDVTHVWRLRDQRLVEVTGYRKRANALEAVGLRE
jgi:ketosteroid isomerase-like protein